MAEAGPCPQKAPRPPGYKQRQRVKHKQRNMAQTPYPTEEQPTADDPSERPRRHGPRPPLAEIDSWELWQAWKRGEREVVVPWIGLLVGFCVVLAAVYAFFFFSTTASDD